MRCFVMFVTAVCMLFLFKKRALDWTTSTRLTVRVRFSNFKPATLSEPSLFMLVLGRESSSWDEMGMCGDNVKPEN